MTDRITHEHRSWNMSRIKSKDTSIEVVVRKYLFKRGYRYRKNLATLPGKPDIVLKKYKTVIFINGCFWHKHENCKEAVIPKTRTEFWTNKLNKNVENDKKHYQELKEMGWKIIILWECQLTKKNFSSTMENLIKLLKPL